MVISAEDELAASDMFGGCCSDVCRRCQVGNMVERTLVDVSVKVASRSGTINWLGLGLGLGRDILAGLSLPRGNQ